MKPDNNHVIKIISLLKKEYNKFLFAQLFSIYYKTLGTVTGSVIYKKMATCPTKEVHENDNFEHIKFISLRKAIEVFDTQKPIATFNNLLKKIHGRNVLREAIRLERFSYHSLEYVEKIKKKKPYVDKSSVLDEVLHDEKLIHVKRLITSYSGNDQIIVKMFIEGKKNRDIKKVFPDIPYRHIVHVHDAFLKHAKLILS